ncbi:FMN-binding protein [Aestuariibacter halophilus]|uniref:FMN-binding protein n=1 Tax=Fluctibacter halophilus TaxID=226011 RepID=A0ABS8GB32_9ALTE|nr:FMN-binding protein [Aestuariibacter halophilus]MCC2617742.1 FMN-binding protein [Aestuariibacter halophilus]
MDKHLINSLWFMPLTVIASPAFAVDYFSIEEAQQLLYPDATAFTAANLSLTDEHKSTIKSLAGTRQRQNEQPVWRVEKDGELQGWFIIDDVVGKHEYITYATAIDQQGNVLGMEILSYRETHGGEVRRESWREQFVGKTAGDTFKLDEDIQNISGATLSCRNLTDGVKRLLVIHEQFLRPAQ